jgi:hypothetical protein
MKLVPELISFQDTYSYSSERCFAHCLLHAGYFLATFLPWRWKRRIPPKLRKNFERTTHRYRAAVAY